MRALTRAEVLVEDKLFATLDTTTRKFSLPNGQQILLIDTVGFIRKLPHLLVAAFKSTLEEAIEADILLHVIDASNPHVQMQVATTCDVLKELGAEKHPQLYILNKIDQCPSRVVLDKLRFRYPKTVALSALQRVGFDLLLERMMGEISLLRKRMRLRIAQSHYALVSEIMKEGKVFSVDYQDNDVLLDVEVSNDLARKVAAFEWKEAP